MHVQGVQDQEQELAGLGYSWEGLRWAMSVLHSRCFTLGSPGGAPVHLTVPGIDMANHSFQANASVRCTAAHASNMEAQSKQSKPLQTWG
jgi:hypothetical protein